MNDSLDVQTIAQRVGLSPRKVRYVLEQRVLPGVRGRPQKHLAGQPRSFTLMEAFFIGCAAALLQGGVQRKTVAELLARLADMPWPLPGCAAQPKSSKPRVPRAFKTAVEAVCLHSGDPAFVLVADGVNVRLRLGEEDTGWLEPRTRARLAEGYRPSVIIQLDLAPLQTAFGLARPA